MAATTISRSRVALPFPVRAVGIWLAAHGVALLVVSGDRPFHYFRADAEWYRWIMGNGYAPLPGRARPTNFFPLLPTLARAVRVVVRSDTAAALLVTLGCAIAAVVLVHAVVRVWRGAEMAATATVVLLAFPGSVFLWQFLTEGLFLALTAGAFLAQERDRPRLAGVLGALAAATRFPGILIVIALLARHRQRSRDGQEAGPRWPLLLPVLGLGSVMVMQWRATGNPLDFLGASEQFGRRSSLPWEPVQEAVAFLFSGGVPGMFRMSLAFHLLTACAVAILCLTAARRRWPASAVVWMTAMALLPLLSGFVVSYGRYALAAWPAAAVAAEVLARRTRQERNLLAAGGAVIALALMAQWTKGAFIG